MNKVTSTDSSLQDPKLILSKKELNSNDIIDEFMNILTIKSKNKSLNYIYRQS